MKVASFYRFLALAEPRAFGDELRTLCRREALHGTILVATEGFNGALAGDEIAIRRVLEWIAQFLALDEHVDARWTDASEAPYRHLRVRLKQEIVTLGRPDILPHERTGTYVEPADWNALIDDPDVLVVDTRNRYEVELGTFPRAIDPATDSFRQFPDFATELAAGSTDRPIAMFCTGGIRCEKATALMRDLGFKDVYHLRGGILNYLATVRDEDNRWNGECFVFDTRVAIDRDLAEGGYVQCHSCRRPLSAADLESPDYREGVSCGYCVGELDADRRERLEERRRQVALAGERGDAHIGPRRS